MPTVAPLDHRHGGLRCGRVRSPADGRSTSRCSGSSRRARRRIAAGDLDHWAHRDRDRPDAVVDAAARRSCTSARCSGRSWRATCSSRSCRRSASSSPRSPRAVGRDPRVSARAKRVSIHNNYFTFPVIVLMVSNHFPAIYGSRLQLAAAARADRRRRGCAARAEHPLHISVVAARAGGNDVGECGRVDCDTASRIRDRSFRRIRFIRAGELRRCAQCHRPAVYRMSFDCAERYQFRPGTGGSGV